MEAWKGRGDRAGGSVFAGSYGATGEGDEGAAILKLFLALVERRDWWFPSEQTGLSDIRFRGDELEEAILVMGFWLLGGCARDTSGRTGR